MCIHCLSLSSITQLSLVRKRSVNNKVSLLLRPAAFFYFLFRSPPLCTSSSTAFTVYKQRGSFLIVLSTSFLSTFATIFVLLLLLAAVSSSTTFSHKSSALSIFHFIISPFFLCLHPFSRPFVPPLLALASFFFITNCEPENSSTYLGLCA